MLFGIIASMTLALSAGTASDDPAEVEGVAQKSNAARPPEAPTVTDVRGESVVQWRGRALISDGRCGGSMCELSLVDSSPTRVGDTYFYLYQIPSAGGGNACDGSDYYVVTIRGDKAWATDSLGGCGEVSSAKPTAAGLQITFSPNFIDGAEVCDVAFGRATCKPQPVEPDSISTVTVEGVLSDGFGFTHYMPFVQRDDDAGVVVIDDNGACAVEKNFDNRVVATIRTTTLANGATHGECLELRVAGSVEASRAASPAPSTEADLVRQYLILSGAREAGMVAVPGMLQNLRAAMPAVPERFWTDFAAEIDANEVIELNVAPYVQRFSRDELLAMIAFYQTPVGQKLGRLLPEITTDVMSAGTEWGRAIGERVVKRLIESGYR
jgi:hypothetical protein